MARWLRETLARAMNRDDADLVIDLNGVEFTNAATVGVIVLGGDDLRRRWRWLALRSPSLGARPVADLHAARHVTNVANRWGP